MAVHNKEIAKILDEIADLLDISGESEFRIRSYRNAAKTISGLMESISHKLDNNEEIISLPGIGKSIAGKVEEISTTGKSSHLEKLREQVPSSLIELMKLEQMGPSRVRLLNRELNIKSIEDLKQAAESGRIEKVKGFGSKTTKTILREIAEYSEKGGSKRVKLNDAGEIGRSLVGYLSEEIENVTLSGSYRRNKETVGDLDIVGISNDPGKAMNHFLNFHDVQRVISTGDAKSSVKLHSGIQADLRISEKESFGAALLYFTGSKPHTVALRQIAQAKGYKMNEYGVYKGRKRLAGSSEKEIYEALGLDYIEPELREDRGEIDAAKNGLLPALITIDDIKGDLQSHTTATDGKFSLNDMAIAAEKKGYEYFAITDHSRKVAMARGLDEKRLAGQINEINELNRKMKSMKILKAIEVDILDNGDLDLPDDILKELDLVVGAIHYNMNLPRTRQTRRILKAMENPHFNILAHPTGRRIGVRKAFDIDMEEIMKAAKTNGCFLEINCNPERLDLNDLHIRQAKDKGVKLAISTDAHSIDNLEYMKYGVAQARRGWIEKDDVINTRSLNDLIDLLKK
jgi:DNA polymerase (family X)